MNLIQEELARWCSECGDDLTCKKAYRSGCALFRKGLPLKDLAELDKEIPNEV